MGEGEYWSSGICCVAIVFFIFIPRFIKKFSKLPPGPPGWPVIGNLLDLGADPHHSLTKLSNKYGPVMWLKLGAVNTMVVSSAEAAMEMFKHHDHIFSGRTVGEAYKAHGFDRGSMSLAQYGPHWRMQRRMYTTELFTKNQIRKTENLRGKCVEKMIRWVREEAEESGAVEIRRFVELNGLNIIGNVALSKDTIADPHSTEGAEFFSQLNYGMVWVAKPNMADFFPILRWLDPQRIRRTVSGTLGKMLSFCSGFVKERILERHKGHINIKKDFLDVMLDFRGTEKDGDEAAIMSEEEIIINILELFIASTDTGTSTVEWAMAELLKNPTAMKSLHEELDKFVGLGNKVEERDIEKLEYLQAVVKETLRLHAPGPFLVPRRAMEDTKFMGYAIPKETQILVNVWAIGRDPACWEDPLSFKPERFLGSPVDYRGQHFEFLPFGGGRRICPGIMLGERMLHLGIASLVHSFDWEPENGVTPDMTDRFGLAVRMRKPLRAVPKPRVLVANNNVKK